MKNIKSLTNGGDDKKTYGHFDFGQLDPVWTQSKTSVVDISVKKNLRLLVCRLVRMFIQEQCGEVLFVIDIKKLKKSKLKIFV